MTTVQNDIYAAGAAQYKVGDFAAAEQTFRRLLDSVPMTDGKEYGRAAHSLALTLVKLGRSPEATYLLRTAIHADPSLQRARDLLAELETAAGQGAGDGLPEPRTAGGLVGFARRVKATTEPDPILGQQRNQCLRFRLETPQGQPTVELRGERIVGSVEEGDVLEIPGPWRPGTQPAWIYNVTTGEHVKAAQSAMRVAQWIILVGFLIGFVIFTVWAYNQVR
jgi:tetratricopeptide (TPR) repeat protein